MLRYQQQYAFFDAAKIGDGSVRFIHLGQQALDGGMAKVLEAMMQELETSSPAIVVVDSFRAMVRSALAGPAGEIGAHRLHAAPRAGAHELRGHDLSPRRVRRRRARQRGVHRGRRAPLALPGGRSQLRRAQAAGDEDARPGTDPRAAHRPHHAIAGYNVFPRILKPEEVVTDHPLKHRLKTGVPGLDELMGGGIPRGYSVLVAGPSGSGKTVLSNQFIVEGVSQGENGIVAVFEKRPNDYLQTTPRGEEFEKLVRRKKLEVLYLRPLDLSIDETLLELREAVKRIGAKRAVIDSLSGLELALAPTFREDFRESLYRMMGALTGLGVTVMATVELADSYVDLRFSPQGIAFLTDAIIIQRYVEIDGELRRAMAVVKLRASQHSKDLREYDITSDGGIVVGKPLKGYQGLLTGTPAMGGTRRTK